MNPPNYGANMPHYFIPFGNFVAYFGRWPVKGYNNTNMKYFCCLV